MTRLVILATLFLGVLVSANKTEAAVKDANNFKGFQTVQYSPWDPREEESSKDDTAREDAQQNQTEE
jgi:hypothetical protein